ncbi:MAG: 4-hydroxy-tetrahydrodipicolinate reductase [Verrucomicrobiota bacterium]|nr:4-hydroxy-tetrahydrodipicolinate reductase [Verrucomicrobiota bacterium]
MKKLRVALVGSAGRMGQSICSAAESENAEITARIDQGDQIGSANGDVLVDFSAPSSASAICALAAEKKMPLVIGTTGHSVAERQAIADAAKKTAIVFASNFSVGVNALFWLTEKAAEILGDGFDLEIVEAHHRLKKDAPSGTAKTLAEILQRARGGKFQHGREGMVGERAAGEIGIHSIRGGDTVGEHTVIFAASGERIELTHRATSRETFARGALRAAHWLVGKAPGLYDMRDVLGLK